MADIAQGVADGWEFIAAGVSVLRDTLGQLGDKLREIFGALIGTNAQTAQSGESWRTLGSVISLVIGVLISAVGILVSALSGALSLASAVIQSIVSLFAGFADIVTGVVFAIGTASLSALPGSVSRSSPAHRVEQPDLRQAGLVVVDPQNGAVRALVGSPQYHEDPSGQINIVTRLRQPGSALRPFIAHTVVCRRSGLRPGSGCPTRDIRQPGTGARSLTNRADFSTLLPS